MSLGWASFDGRQELGEVAIENRLLELMRMRKAQLLTYSGTL